MNAKRTGAEIGAQINSRSGSWAGPTLTASRPTTSYLPPFRSPTSTIGASTEAAGSVGSPPPPSAAADRWVHPGLAAWSLALLMLRYASAPRHSYFSQAWLQLQGPRGCFPVSPPGGLGAMGGVPSLGQGSKLKRLVVVPNLAWAIYSCTLSGIDVLVYILALDIHEDIWAA